jgi:S1-C subfamily serine protease
MRKHLLIGAALALFATPAAAADTVQAAELDRVKLIQKVRPAVVSVFMKDFTGDPRGRIAGGGSGVIIDPEGYCLTNYHVVAGPGMSGVTPTFACGLPNGEMYDAVTVGCDRTGDAALIKLYPKKPGEKFPVAELGDSSLLRAGDWTLIMGNAQLLSTDFTPSVSFGLVSGVGRYSDFGFAEHTDAIQYDTTANQGNSGGPIFNMKGQVIGLVYGGAPGKRGAFNTGSGTGCRSTRPRTSSGTCGPASSATTPPWGPRSTPSSRRTGTCRGWSSTPSWRSPTPTAASSPRATSC